MPISRQVAIGVETALRVFRSRNGVWYLKLIADDTRLLWEKMSTDYRHHALICISLRNVGESLKKQSTDEWAGNYDEKASLNTIDAEKRPLADYSVSHILQFYITRENQ